MPSKDTDNHEYCLPCLWRKTVQVQFGAHPINKMYCGYPMFTDRFSRKRKIGKLIGQDNEKRPDWCPLRDDQQAEQNATRGKKG